MPKVPGKNIINDKWFRVSVIFVTAAISIALNVFYNCEQTNKTATKMLVVWVFVAVLWHLMRSLIFYFRFRYPSRKQIGKRSLFIFLSGILVVTLVFWLEEAIQHWIACAPLRPFLLHTETKNFCFNLALMITNFIFFQTIWETMFFIRERSFKEKELVLSEREMEKLQMANLQSQLDALKQQINPHFFFNSLNVLDSLIEDDAPRARIFLEELGMVYRYLLKSSEYQLIELAGEMDFIRSYFYLLKTRLGEGLQLIIQIDHKYDTYQLPPLTIQLLLENTFIHNIVLPEQPLIIKISTDDYGNLEVQNNVQRKKMVVVSNGAGLNNILDKYRILQKESPKITEEHGQFVVSVPLIPAIFPSTF